MAMLFFFRVEQRPRPIGFAVILQLECITADEELRRPYEARQGLLIIAKESEISGVRRVAGHDQQHRNGMLVAAGHVGVIGQVPMSLS